MSMLVVLRGGERDGHIEPMKDGMEVDEQLAYLPLGGGPTRVMYRITDEVVTLGDGRRARVAVPSRT